MPTRNEKIEFIRDVLRQARVRECIGKVCEECKFYDSPNCLETCYATELVDMGIVQIPEEKQNAPAKPVATQVDPIEFKKISDELHAGIVKVLTNCLEPYVMHRLNTYVNTIKKQALSFLMRDTSNGQYYDEQYVPVAVIDHVLSLFSGVDTEK